MRTRTTGLAALTAVAALGLASCSSSGGTSAAGSASGALASAAGSASSAGAGGSVGTGGSLSDGGSLISAAYTHTVTQKTAKMSLTESVSAGRASTSSGPSGSSNASATITASGSVDFANKAADLTASVQGEQLEIREIGETVYLHAPAALAQKLPGGKSWISIDLAAVAQQELGTSLDSLTQTSDANPTQMLDYLQAVSSSGVHKEGTTTLHGVSSTEYDATVDLNKLETQEKSAAAKAAVTKLVTQLGTSSYPMKVWIGSDDLVHQLQFAIDAHPAAAVTSTASAASSASAAAPALPVDVSVIATVQLFDYGSAVSVVAPPADQTTDLTGEIASASPQA